MIKFLLKTNDNLIEHKAVKVYVFTNIFDKKVKKKEFYSPPAARVVVFTEDSLFHYILVRPIIKSDSEGNITVHSAHEYEKVIGNVEYISEDKKNELKRIKKIYMSKATYGLSSEETVELGKTNSLIELNDLLRKKLPYDKGGGF